MILHAHGIRVPMAGRQPALPVAVGPAPSAALRPPDPAQLARMAAGQGQPVPLVVPAQQSVASAAAPWTTAPAASDVGIRDQAPAQTPKTTWTTGIAAAGALPHDAAQLGGGAGVTTGLNAAIASLSMSLNGNTARSLDDTAKVNEWDEVLRYLRLLGAVQAEGAPSWEPVRSAVLQLRDQHAAGTARPDNLDGTRGSLAAAAHSADALALQEVRTVRQAALREAEGKEAELRAAQQQVRD